MISMFALLAILPLLSDAADAPGPVDGYGRRYGPVPINGGVDPRPEHQRFEVGDIVYRKGRNATIVKVHWTEEPVAYTVRMDDTNQDVGTEADNLSRTPQAPTPTPTRTPARAQAAVPTPPQAQASNMFEIFGHYAGEQYVPQAQARTSRQPNWTCRQCHESNKHERQLCNGCNVVTKPNDWTCTECGEYNKDERQQCNGCKVNRPDAPQPTPPAPQPKPQLSRQPSWTCGDCHEFNRGERQQCNNCKVENPAKKARHEEPCNTM